MATTLGHAGPGTVPQHALPIPGRRGHQSDPGRLTRLDSDSLYLCRVENMGLVVDFTLVDPLLRPGLYLYVPVETRGHAGTDLADHCRAGGRVLFTVQLRGRRARACIEHVSVCVPAGSIGSQKFQRLL